MSKFEEQDYNKLFDFKVWKRLFLYMKPYKKHMAIMFAAMVILAGVDSAFPYMSKIAIDKFVMPKSIDGLWKFCIIIAGILIIQASTVWVMIRIAGAIETGLGYDVRQKGFNRLQELSLSYFDKTPVGWIMTRLTSDVRRLSGIMTWGFVDLFWSLASIIFMSIVMINIDWKMGLITLSTIPFLIAVSLYFSMKILKLFRKARKVNSRITAAFNEGIMGSKTIKTLVREKENLEEFQEITGEYYVAAVRTAKTASLYTPVVIFLGSIGTGAVLWYGGAGVYADVISFGTLVAFMNFTVQFFEPVKQFARVVKDFQQALACAERTFSLIETEPDIKDSEEVLKKYIGAFEGQNGDLSEMHGDISFRNVSFSYIDGEKVLEDFDLDIKAGETIALVGETGSGKSTIVNLACRFYEPTSGQILIDGVNYLEKPLLWLHSNLGYVLQQPHLFSGTIKDNIAYGRLDASEEEIIEASKLVNAHEFITNMEKGYDTEVGEGGSLLSTGQKQLVSFARAILANPRIFVLDEATSSVDTETEQIIQEAIQKVLKGRTSFIIAHRLSTIRSADRILVIQDGKVIEHGSHKQLLKQQGYYHRLYTNQFMDEKEGQLLGA